MIFFGYQPFEPFLQHSVVDKTGTITHTTPVPLPRPVMMHDAAITARHTIFIDTPALFDLLGIVRGQPFLKWAPEYGARIGVLPRYAKGEAIKWFEIDNCFVFHVFNAYEKDREIVVHACRYKKYPSMLSLSGNAKNSGPAGALENLNSLIEDATAVAFTWRLNPTTGKVVETRHDDVGTEFPQTNQGHAGQPARYGDCTGHTNIEVLHVYKYDFETGERSTHVVGKDRIAGEARFVPRENARSEDDGYLVTLTCHRAEQTSELVVLFAGDLAAEPLARVIIPQTYPVRIPRHLDSRHVTNRCASSFNTNASHAPIPARSASECVSSLALAALRTLTNRPTRASECSTPRPRIATGHPGRCTGNTRTCAQRVRDGRFL